MKSLNILFLGAGKRLSLLERFQAAAGVEGATLRMWAVERDRHVPVAAAATVLTGPDFTSAECGGYLVSTVKEFGIDLVIPNMDAATVSLARVKRELAALGCWAVVSEHLLCRIMEDKVLANEWFQEHGWPLPAQNGYPRIVKRRRGYGSRDQLVAWDEVELRAFFRRRKAEDYFCQAYMDGQEYTVDAYVDRTGRLLGALSRKRLQVIAGEVDISETCHHDGILRLTSEILAVRGWEGPITLQFIDTQPLPVLLEINPRFGGGATHAIECGLDMPRWIIREQFGLPVHPVANWPEGSIMTRCRRDIFLWSS